MSDAPPPYANRKEFDHGMVICEFQDQLKDAVRAGKVARMRAAREPFELPPVLRDGDKLSYCQRALEIVRCYSADPLSRLVADLALKGVSE